MLFCLFPCHIFLSLANYNNRTADAYRLQAEPSVCLKLHHQPPKRDLFHEQNNGMLKLLRVSTSVA